MGGALAINEIAVEGELSNERIDLFEGGGGDLHAFEVAPQKAVRRRARFEREVRGVFRECGPVFPRERQDAENAARREHALGAVDGVAHGADGCPRPARDVEERQCFRRRARGAIGVRDAMMPTARAEVFAQQLPGARVEDAHVEVVPLHGHALTDPAGWHAVIRGLDFHAAIEVDAPHAVAVVAKGLQRQRAQMRALLRKHRTHLALGRAMDARVRPARVPLIEVRLRGLHRLEAHPTQRGLLRVPDPRFHFAFPIRIAHAARERDDAVVREHVAIERVDLRVVHIGLQHAFAQIIEHDDAHRAAESPKRFLVQLGPALTAGAPRQQAHGLARKAERQDKEPRATVFPARRIADHRPFAVIDLRLFAGRRRDDARRLRGVGPAQAPDEATYARITPREAVPVDQVLKDRHGVPAAPHALDDERAVRLARARGRRSSRRGRCRRRVPRVGGHRGTGGRIWGRPLRRLAPAPPDGDAGALEIATDRLAAHTGRRLNPSKRPPQSPQADHLLLYGFVQDVAHRSERPIGDAPLSTSQRATCGGRFSGVH